ncbi:RNA-binding protein [Candidatus Giovannonibacteria bacterium]|nr:RNA-binding protein [Candidatus Giovannonibacteria bacterium]
MAKKLYVGSLSYGTTDAQLKDHFAQCGQVESAQVVMDRMSGRSRGFGFVEMSSDEEADKAVEMLDGKELDGRTLVVKEARPMTERPPRREGGFRGGRSGGGGGFGSRGGGGGYGRREF